MANERHGATQSFLLNRFLGCAFRADEQDGAAIGDQLTNELGRLAEQRQGALQIDNMNAIALTENERCHFRIPKTGLVAKMHPRFQHPAHGDVGHGNSSLGLVLHAPPPTTFHLVLREESTQPRVSARV